MGMLGMTVVELPFGEELKPHTNKLGSNFLPIGSKMRLPDGRTFRLASTGAVTLVQGTLVQSAVPVANHIAQTIVTATAAGATSVAVTLGATSLDYDQYGGGVIEFESDGTAAGTYYPIIYNALDFNRALANAAASAAISVPLQTGYSLSLATNTSDIVNLIMNPWTAVVINATAQTAPCVGVANVAAVTHGTIDATGGNASGTQMGDLTWVQTSGLCAVRQDATTGVAGQPAFASATTAGDVGLGNTTIAFTNPIVGQFVTVPGSAEFATVNLSLEQ